MFPSPSWLRKGWFFCLKEFIGFGLRFGIFPKRHHKLLGYLHHQISGVVFGIGADEFRRMLLVEVSSICNAKCSFCPYPILDFPRKLMSDDLFKRALDLSARLDIREFDMTPYLGEAFVDPQFLARIRQIRACLPEVGISFITNGTFFTRCDCVALLTSGVQRISVSFGAWGREDYLKLYNIDAWDTVLAGVKKLLDAKRALKSDVKIALWYRTLNANQVRLHPENLEFLATYQDLLYEIEYTDVYYDIMTISGRQPKHIQLMPQLDFSALKRPPCANLSKLAINSTGNVFMCYCGSTDCYKQEKSWFYIGSMHKQFDVNEALTAKLAAWERGEMPEYCKNCLVYVPSKPGRSIMYGTGLPAPNIPAPTAEPGY